MITLTNDRLFRLLCDIKKCPELLLGTKSIVALESYINGYLHACEGNSDSVRWYEKFLDYVAKCCDVEACPFNISEVLKGCGYDDYGAIDYFMELLGQFAKSNYSFTEPHANSASLSDGEIRAFRVDKSKATSLISNYVQLHVKELFGVPFIADQQVLLFQWEYDGTLTCALCNDVNCVSKISSSSDSLPHLLQDVNVCRAPEIIKFTTIK